MTLVKKISTGFAIGCLALGATTGISAPAFADEKVAETSAASLQDIFNVEEVSPTEIKISSDEYNFIEKDGVAVMENMVSGEIEMMPEYVITQQGEKLDLAYLINDDGTVSVKSVLASNADSGVALRGIGDDAKCWANVFGKAGTTGIAGAGIGAVGGPTGAMGGAILGSVIGGIDGATACFEQDTMEHQKILSPTAAKILYSASFLSAVLLSFWAFDLPETYTTILAVSIVFLLFLGIIAQAKYHKK